MGLCIRQLLFGRNANLLEQFVVVVVFEFAIGDWEKKEMEMKKSEQSKRKMC